MESSSSIADIVSTSSTRCCIVGAGPAGAMLGLLLSRKGVQVTLLESHHDFDRDFRGDTVHPSTLEILDQLGLAERLHQFPHGKVSKLEMHTPKATYTFVDLSRLHGRFPYILMVPQVHLLELLTAEAKRYPNFQLLLGANVQRLIQEDGAIRGVCYRDVDNNWQAIRAELTVAADGRFSKIRHLAGVEPVGNAPPMDVLWFRLPRLASDTHDGGMLYVGSGHHFLVLLERGTEWQIGYVILKGTFAEVRAAGLDTVRQGLVSMVPWLADRAGQLQDWKQIAVLNVESSRVPKWYQPGLLLIGDAAHVMSPVAGVGINYAIQDAVETANLLTEPLKRGKVSVEDLAKVQNRRELPVKFIQRVQRLIQDRIASPSLQAGADFKLPWFLRVMLAVPGLRSIPARKIGYGIRRVRIDE